MVFKGSFATQNGKTPLNQLKSDIRGPQALNVSARSGQLGRSKNIAVQGAENSEKAVQGAKNCRKAIHGAENSRKASKSADDST